MAAVRQSAGSALRSPARHKRRRAWWVGALDRELLAIGQYVDHRIRITVAGTALLAMIYLAGNGGSVE